MSLDAFQDALDALRADAIDVAAFSTRVRAQPLPATLPPRYGEVLADLLDRLESSAMFSGESCSFSQRDLQDQVQVWIDKASQRLAA